MIGPRTRALAAGALMGASLCAHGAGMRFDYRTLIIRAQALARRPCRPDPPDPSLGHLDYRQYRSVHFRASRTIWAHRFFSLQLFAPGYRFRKAVRVSVIDGKKVVNLPFRPTDFVYPRGLYGRGLSQAGFAGFRLLYRPYPRDPAVSGENGQVIVFLGASYFRVKGAREQFGTSARAVAIDTIATHAEEFPRFVHFWIRRPSARARRVIVYGLLEGAAVTGAFRFVVVPGETAHVLVTSRLFLRHPVQELGLAPLSSMYMYDLFDRHPWAYLRPAVHDSEGFLFVCRQRFVWRQLANPARVRQFPFACRNPRGFGLLQRDRRFTDYESLSMRYQQRPSVWISRRGHWGAGAVVLIEIPTPDEANDNIVAFWRPAHEIVGRPLRFDYEMTWGRSGPPEPVAEVTRSYATLRRPARPVRVAIDFAGDALLRAQPLRAHVQVAQATGRVSAVSLRRLPGPGHWRLLFTVSPRTRRPVRVRAWLTVAGRTVSEVWDYVLAAGMGPVDAREPACRARGSA